MKKITKTAVISTLLFSLAGCAPDTPPETPIASPESIYEIAGKTFYNRADKYKDMERPQLWLAKDKSFVLMDYDQDVSYEITGDWQISENVVTLNVTNTEKGNYKTIKLEVLNNDELSLKISLQGSAMNDYFVVEGRLSVEGHTTVVPNGTPQFNEGDLFEIVFADDGIATYCNETKGLEADGSMSFLQLYDDGTFQYTDVEAYGAVGVAGRYGREGNVLMFSNFTNVFHDLHGEEVSNFEFIMIGPDILMLNEDMNPSLKGDEFVLSPNGSTQASVPMRTKSFTHEHTDACDDRYLPEITFNTDGSFVFVENCYSNMNTIRGIWERTSYGYFCTITDRASMQGFMGYDQKELVFEEYSIDCLILQNDYCLSKEGDRFYLHD